MIRSVLWAYLNEHQLRFCTKLGFSGDSSRLIAMLKRRTYNELAVFGRFHEETDYRIHIVARIEAVRCPSCYQDRRSCRLTW